MSKVFEMAFELSGKVNSSLKSAFKSIHGDTKSLNEKLAGLEKVRGNAKRFEGLRKELIETNREYIKAQQSLGDLARETQSATEKTNKLQAEFKKAEKETRKLKQTLDEKKIALNHTKDALEETGASQEQISRQTGKLERSIENITIEYENFKEKLKQLSKETRGATTNSNKLESEFSKAKNTTSSLSGKLDEQKSALSDLKGSLNEAGISTQNFSKDQAKLEKTLAKVSKAQANYQESKSKLEGAKQNTAEARGRLVDAVGMAGSLVVPVKLAIDAENTMADVKKVVDFEDALDIKNMEKKIVDITKEIPMSFNEIGEIIAAGGQAGIDKVELPTFAIDAAKMGVAYDVSADAAGQMMAEWRSAFQMDQGQVRGLADKINYLGDSTSASATKISEVVTKIGPLGEISGVASGEIAALGATLVGMGISEDVAATGIKNLMLTMNAGEGATKSQASAFKSLGFDAQDMAKKMQTDSKGAIMDLLGALKQVPEHARAATLQKLIGKESIGAIAPLLNNIGELERNLQSVDETQKKFSGSMESEFQARADTTGNSLILLQNQLQNIGKTFGDVLLPPLLEAAEKLGAFAGKVQEFAEKYPNITQGIVMATAAFLLFNIALIGGVYAGSLLKQSYLTVGNGLDKLKLLWAEGKVQALGQAIATKTVAAAKMGYAGVCKLVAVAQGALNAVMTAFPGFLIIAAILAVIAIGVALYQNWDVVKEKLGQLWSWFSEKFPGMAEFASNAAGVIKDTFGKAINWVKEKVAGLGEAWEKVKGFFGGGGSSGGSGSTSKLPGYATGGIVTSPQIAWVGEGGSAEAIIPLEKTANSIGLWQQTGKMLGMDLATNTSPMSQASNLGNQEGEKFRGIQLAASHSDKSDNLTVKTSSDSGNKYEFSFNIDARGASDGVDEDIEKSILQKVIPIVMRAIDQRDRDKKRLEIK